MSSRPDLTPDPHHSPGFDAALARAIDKAVGSGIAIVDTSGCQTHVNDAFCRMVGWSRDELLGATAPHVYWPEEELEPITAALQMALDGRFPADGMMLRFKRRDGTRFPALLLIAPLETGDGAAGWVANVIDLTEQQAHLTALRESEQRFRDLVEVSADWFWEVDANCRYTFTSPSVEQVLGYTPAEMLGREPFDLMPPDEAARVRAIFMAHVERREPFRDLENLNIAKDGRQVYLMTNGLPHFDAAGNFTGYRGGDRNITARRLAEEQTRILSTAITQSPTSVIVSDPQLQIVYVNEAFCRITGFRRSEVVGQPTSILGAGTTPPKTIEAMHAAVAAGVPWTGEVHNRRKDGRVGFDLSHITPVRDANGRVTHFVEVHEDVTEKRRLAAELEAHREGLEALVAERTTELFVAKAEAEAATQAKSAFLANMSHEIRTPLNAILGIAHLLRRSGVTPLQGEQLDKIAGAGRHLLGIINDVLDLARIEAGKLELVDEDFTVEQLAHGIDDIVTESARARGLALDFELGALPRVLRGDRIRLQQALLNYLGNAIKFTPHGHIALRAQVLQETPDDCLVRLEVEDTGVGIAPEALGRLFVPFQQVDEPLSRQAGGTGLGLAITKRLAALMGGDVGVDSAPGRGSRFWMTARLGKGLSGADPAIADPVGVEATLRREHLGKRVLLAEDDEFNQEVATEMLRAVGLAADIASNGREAVRMAQGTDYALILMDLRMPGMDGIAATRAIRALPGRAHTPIIAVTANVYDEDRRACADVGMNDFLTKPLDPERLYEALAQWLAASVHKA